MSRWIDIDDDRNCFCGNDGEYEKWNIDPDVLKDAITIEQLHWIPVTERNPKYRGHYLCSYHDYVRSEFWTGGSWYGYAPYAITAWAPMPEAYKGGEEDGN